MRSVRFQVQALVVGAVLLASALTGGVAAVLVRGRVEEQARTALARQADALAAAVDSGRRAAASRPRVFLARGGRPRRIGDRRGNDALAAGVLARAAPGESSEGTAEVGGKRVFYAVREASGGQVVLVRKSKLETADWRPFALSILVAALAGALAAGAGAALLARRLTRPLAELSAAARALARGEAGARVDVRGRDELANVGSAFNAMADDLAAARDSERRFLMSVSHELKTPLTAVRGYAEALCENAAEPRSAGATIAAEAKRLERIVQDLIELAKLEQRSLGFEPRAIDLGDVAREALARFSPSARAEGKRLEVLAPDAAPAFADPGRVLQALANLIDNALRATPAGGTVVVHTTPGRITVRDQGPGIAAEDLPRAFEAFHLSNRYANDRDVGSGLGLAIVRELVQGMKGEVSVMSAEGAGAAFEITLPVGSQPKRR